MTASPSHRVCQLLGQRASHPRDQRTRFGESLIGGSNKDLPVQEQRTAARGQAVKKVDAVGGGGFVTQGYAQSHSAPPFPWRSEKTLGEPHPKQPSRLHVSLMQAGG